MYPCRSPERLDAPWERGKSRLAALSEPPRDGFSQTQPYACHPLLSEAGCALPDQPISPFDRRLPGLSPCQTVIAGPWSHEPFRSGAFPWKMRSVPIEPWIVVRPATRFSANSVLGLRCRIDRLQDAIDREYPDPARFEAILGQIVKD